MQGQSYYFFKNKKIDFLKDIAKAIRILEKCAFYITPY